MNLPDFLINVDNYLIPGKNGLIDKIKFIKDACIFFEQDFICKSVFWNKIKVGVRSKKLDCSICNNDCNNDFCTCSDCPWANKLDIFQHVTSDYDPHLENKLTKEAFKKLKKRRKTDPDYKVRTPGIYCRSRTNRIKWLKLIIEDIDNDDIITKISRTRINEEKIKIYHQKQNYLIILSRTEFKDGTFEIFLNSAYHKPYQSLLRDIYK